MMKLNKSLWYDALAILFKDNVLLSGQPEMIWYYLNSFSRLIESSSGLIEENECEKISDKLQNHLIPVLTSAERQYSSKTPTLFEILGNITQNSDREINLRVEATKNILEFITTMFNNAKNFYQLKLCK